MKNQYRYCFTCGRYDHDHEDMDHPFKTRDETIAEYAAAAALEDVEKIRLQRISDGKDARANLRNDVKELLDAHFQESTAPSYTGEIIETNFLYLMDAVRDSLDTLEETIGV